MNKLIISMVLILSIICSAAYAADLSDYPDLFFDDGKFNAKLIVGASAPAQDVLDLNILTTYLQTYALSEYGQGSTIPSTASVLDSEFEDIYSMDFIAVGSPCVNKVTYELLGEPEDCDSVIAEGNAKIMMLNKGDNIQVLVLGGSQEDRRAAVKVLSNPDKYSLKGNEVCLRTGPSTSVIDCSKLSAPTPKQTSTTSSTTTTSIASSTSTILTSSTTYAQTSTTSTTQVSVNLPGKADDKHDKSDNPGFFKRIARWISNLF
jgi:hypothetical protein